MVILLHLTLKHSIWPPAECQAADQHLRRLTWLRKTSANIPPSSSRIKHTVRVYMNCNQIDKREEKTLHTVTYTLIDFTF